MHFFVKTLLILTFIYTFTSAQNLPKFSIFGNGNIKYHTLPTNVEHIDEMFKEGIFYGRLRTNNFFFNFDHQDSKKQTYFLSGFGGSLIHKSASFKGVSTTFGFYGSHAFFNENYLNSIGNLKSSKDALNRFSYANGGSTSLYTLGQANINFKYQKSNIRIGRQLMETFYTKSNDSKMIPNAFDGIVIQTNELKDTTIQLGYLAKQKLRDHQESTFALVYGDSNSTQNVNRPEWSQNDDSAMHRGLTYSALKAHNKPTNSPLIVLDAQNRTINNLKIDFSSYLVPKLLSQIRAEVNYKIDFNYFSITSGIRYVQQFDHGAGEVGGASLRASEKIYKNPNSLNAQMIASRMIVKKNDYSLKFAYTNILDKSDFVAPWRAFPTASYTRSMGIYNWRANTKSYRVEFVRNNSNAFYQKESFIQTSILYIDEDKQRLEGDSLYYYFGRVKNLSFLPNLMYKIRFGYRDYLNKQENLPDYLDSRLEFNYLF